MANVGSFLVEEHIVPVKRISLTGVGVIGALDRGCTLTKVLYSSERDAEHYNLHFALFKNNEFEAGLEYLQQRGFVVQDPTAKLHVTGVGCDKFRDVIREKLGLEIEFIDEFLTQSRGTHWLVANVEDELLCYQDPPANEEELSGIMSNPFVKSMGCGWRQHMQQYAAAESQFPCCMMFMGSAGGIMKIEESGNSETVGGVWLAGMSFLGLCKLVIGTDNYDEVYDLAERGDRAKVDLQIKDVMANQQDSPYGAFPQEMSLFSFGKLVATGKCREDFSREDLARSLVFAFANNTVRAAILAARVARTTNFYLGGNFFRHPLIRSEMRNMALIYCHDAMKLKFLRTGHTGAVGAMISKQEDLLRFMQLRQTAMRAAAAAAADS